MTAPTIGDFLVAARRQGPAPLGSPLPSDGKSTIGPDEAMAIATEHLLRGDLHSADHIELSLREEGLVIDPSAQNALAAALHPVLPIAQLRAAVSTRAALTDRQRAALIRTTFAQAQTQLGRSLSPDQHREALLAALMAFRSTLDSGLSTDPKGRVAGPTEATRSRYVRVLVEEHDAYLQQLAQRFPRAASRYIHWMDDAGWDQLSDRDVQRLRERDPRLDDMLGGWTPPDRPPTALQRWELNRALLDVHDALVGNTPLADIADQVEGYRGAAWPRRLKVEALSRLAQILLDKVHQPTGRPGTGITQVLERLLDDLDHLDADAAATLEGEILSAVGAPIHQGGDAIVQALSLGTIIGQRPLSIQPEPNTPPSDYGRQILDLATFAELAVLDPGAPAAERLRAAVEGMIALGVGIDERVDIRQVDGAFVSAFELADRRALLFEAAVDVSAASGHRAFLSEFLWNIGFDGALEPEVLAVARRSVQTRQDAEALDEVLQISAEELAWARAELHNAADLEPEAMVHRLTFLLATADVDMRPPEVAAFVALAGARLIDNKAGALDAEEAVVDFYSNVVERIDRERFGSAYDDAMFHAPSYFEGSSTRIPAPPSP